jgi:hypothetical protein
MQTTGTNKETRDGTNTTSNREGRISRRTKTPRKIDGMDFAQKYKKGGQSVDPLFCIF